MLNTSTIVEQVAAHLRDQLRDGHWTGLMPGRDRLAAELGISKTTLDRALALLEKEGLLESRGGGRRRRIRMPEKIERASPLRVTVMLYEPEDKEWIITLKLHSQLQEAGYQVQFAAKSLLELKMDPRQVARLVEPSKADAWVVFSGSREVLEWFAAQPTPVMALAGRYQRLPIAGTCVDTSTIYPEMVRHLYELGHRRMVMISSKMRRVPKPGRTEREMLDEMQRLGIATGAYHLPEWEDTPEGLRNCLDSLFAVTPPQALIMETPILLLAVLKHLQQQGIEAPRDVSLACLGKDPSFDWFEPTVSHIEWDKDKLVGNVMRWVRTVERGKPSRRKPVVKPQLFEGGTIGPVPNR